MIRIQNVYKSFGTQKILQGVSLEIPEGKTTAIVGPSGVGKSVLMKLILGMHQPESGDITVFGKNISHEHSERKKNEIRRELGVLFQSAALLDSLTLFDNISFPLEARLGRRTSSSVEKTNHLLEALSLRDYAFMYPQEVSIGTRKRAGLARALITEPRAVLFDEPNTGLDPLVGQEVYDLIKSCQRRWCFTGIVISHELPEVFQISDRVAMLLGGKVVQEGTPEEIQASTEPSVVQFLNGWTNGPIKIQ